MFTDLLGKVARLHYEHGLTHQQIATALGLSRVKVTRLLGEARRAGIVEIRIHSDAAPFEDLEVAMTDAFPVSEVRVVPDQEDAERARDSLAVESAHLLERIVADGMVVAIGLSRTIGAMPAHVRAASPVDCTFVSLVGSRARSASGINPHEATTALAQAYRSQARHLPAPTIAGSVELADAFRQDPAIAETLDLAANAEVAFLGVGGVRGHVELLANGDITEAEFDELVAAGAIGDVAARFFRPDMRPVDHPVDSRIVGLSIERLQAIPSRVVVAAGDEKVPALEACLRAGFATTLITDAGTAGALLSRAGTAARRAPSK